MSDAVVERSRTRQVLIAWLPAIAYMALIWTLSSFSMVPVPIDRVPFKDKGVHFVEYGVLAFLVGHALRGTWPQLGPVRRLFAAVLLSLVWGMLDEIHQAYVPGRLSDIRDVVADGLGGLLGASLFWAAHRFLPARR